jgi:hypothetical protein
MVQHKREVKQVSMLSPKMNPFNYKPFNNITSLAVAQILVKGHQLYNCLGDMLITNF